MKTYFSLLLSFLLCTCVCAQEDQANYRQLVEEAKAAYQADLPRKALKLYIQAFSISKHEVADLLRAAEIAESIKKLSKAEELFIYLFDNYPLETAITFFEDPEFENDRNSPFLEVFQHRASFGLGPHQNGKGKPDRFGTAPYRYAMPNDSYILLVEIASRSMRRKDYQRASYYYELVFSMKRKSKLSLLRAAACAAFNDDYDAASSYVEEAFVSFPNSALKIIRLMPDFEEALSNPQFVALIGREINRHFPQMDTKMVAEIDRLNALFLTHRKVEPDTDDVSGIPSYKLLIANSKTRVAQDSLDRIISASMDSLLNVRGYPSTRLVADRISEFDRLFYAVAPEVIMDHWEDILLKSVEEDFSFFRDPSSLANRYDYNCYSRGLKQKFGNMWSVPESLKSAGIAVWPIENPLAVDKRRAVLGMEPLKKNMRNFRKKVNLKAQNSLGELPIGIRGEVHAKSYPRKEISGYPFDYQ